MVFAIPRNSMKKVNPLDIDRVMNFVEEETGLEIVKRTGTGDGTMQFRFGTKKGHRRGAILRVPEHHEPNVWKLQDSNRHGGSGSP